MKEQPIIMSGDHPKLILDGLKTMTRRTWGLEQVNKNPDYWVSTRNAEGTAWWIFQSADGSLMDAKCPYGQVGDRLWVKETTWVSDCGKYHCYLGQASGNVISETIKYTRDEDNPFQIFGFSVLSHSSPNKKGYAFKRWFGEVDLNKDPWTDTDFALTTIEAQFHKKKPSIHMPRWAPRILLEITEIRAERSQEITEEDAIREGFPEETRWKTKQAPWRIVWFKELWDSLNAKRGYGWDKNSWVWVIGFKVLR